MNGYNDMVMIVYLIAFLGAVTLLNKVIHREDRVATATTETSK